LLEQASSKLNQNLNEKDFKVELQKLYKGLTGEDLKIDSSKSAADYWNDIDGGK